MAKLDAEKCATCNLGPPDWVYLCCECQTKFTMPAPKGPSEEKSRACTKCGGKNIKRIDTVKSEVCSPGG